MLTEQQKAFVHYWEENRMRKKKVMNQLTIGLPLAVALVTAIGISAFSGWYKRADMIINTHASTIPVILIAAIGIVVFITIFSVRHRWDLNEQQYREFLSRKDETNASKPS